MVGVHKDFGIAVCILGNAPSGAGILFRGVHEHSSLRFHSLWFVPTQAQSEILIENSRHNQQVPLYNSVAFSVLRVVVAASLLLL